MAAGDITRDINNPVTILNSAAAAAAAEDGFTVADVYSHVLLQAQEDNPMLLLGGYFADVLVVGTWLALRQETYAGRDLDPSEIRHRINAVLQAAYAGLI